MKEKEILECIHKGHEIRHELDMIMQGVDFNVRQKVVEKFADLIIEDLNSWGLDDRDRSKRIEYWETIRKRL